MSTVIFERSNGSRPKTLAEVQQMFLDPRDPNAAEKLAQLSSDALNTMAMIYAFGGDIGRMPEETRAWLTGQKDNGPVEGFARVQQVIGQVLCLEADTRRFDHKSMGQIHPQGFTGAIVGHEIAAYTNENTIVREVSKAASQMEDHVVNWTLDMVGYNSKESSGNIVAGGSTANLLAMWVAREYMRKQRGYNGRLAIIETGMAHYSIKKAAWILDMDTEDAGTNGFKTDWDTVEEKIKEVRASGREVAAIVALAGETETGLVDDMNKAAEVARRNGVRLHVDAAYGGPFIMSRNGDLFGGINQADSITIDPHKYLFVPYPSAIAMFRDRSEHALVQNGARYLQECGNQGLMGDPAQRNLGLSARVEGSMGAAGAISTYIAIESFGKSGYRVLLDHTLDLTEKAYDFTSRSSVLYPVHVPELNTLLVGVRPEVCDPDCVNEVMKKAKGEVEKQGKYVSDNEEVCGGKDAFRVVPTHPFTTAADVEDVLMSLEEEVVKAIPAKSRR